MDAAADAYLTGLTGSSDFPTTPDAYQKSGSGFLTKLNPGGSGLLYSSHLSNSAFGIAVDSSGDPYAAYETATYGLVSGGAVAKFSLAVDALWGLTMSPRSFSLNGRRANGRCVRTTRRKRAQPRCVRPIKLRISYQLTAPAKVKLTFKRQLSGRVVSGRCVKTTRANGRRRSCVRLVPLSGALKLAGHEGSNSLSFDGRIGGHNLTAGRYQVVAAPTVGVQVGNARTITFSITAEPGRRARA